MRKTLTISVLLTYARFVKNEGEEEAGDYDEFLFQEERDLKNTGLIQLLASDLIDYKVKNNGTLAELYKQLDNIVKKII